MKTGLVIGKFYPPHAGHSFLIETAQAQVDDLVVLICDNPNYHISAAQRKSWLETIHPNTNIKIIPDLNDEDNSKAWAEHTINFLGYQPDTVFSSEEYGQRYARFMGSKHVLVDKERATFPVSGTKVRKDVLAEWEFLKPAVRAKYAIRVCVLGAESTGTTTLSKALATHYGTSWVPEYGRYYTESLNDVAHVWHSQEFTHIAQMQQLMENQLAGESNGILICDTNAFATRLWHERYMGEFSADVDHIASRDKVDLYVLTGDEIPFVQDGIRDGEHIRHDMHKRFIRELHNLDTPYIQVNGSVKHRLNTVIQSINQIVERKITI